MIETLMPQRIRNWWGSRERPSPGGGSHSYCRCDGCGNTLWRNLKGAVSVYTKDPVAKANYPLGATFWEFCGRCNPEDSIPRANILRAYGRDEKTGWLYCLACGREHPANVCYQTHTDEALRVLGRGFPMVIGKPTTLNLKFRVPIEDLTQKGASQ